MFIIKKKLNPNSKEFIVLIKKRMEGLHGMEASKHVREYRMSLLILISPVPNDKIP